MPRLKKLSAMKPATRTAILKRWLELLRSGTVKPGRGELIVKRSDGTLCYCAMGALGLALQEERYLEVGEYGFSPEPVFKDADGLSYRSMFGSHVTEALGLDIRIGRRVAQDAVMHFNDRNHYKQTNIADRVEKALVKAGVLAAA